jgi:hypothetical protein
MVHRGSRTLSPLERQTDERQPRRRLSPVIAYQPTGPIWVCGFRKGIFLAPAATELLRRKTFKPSVMFVS